MTARVLPLAPGEGWFEGCPSPGERGDSRRRRAVIALLSAALLLAACPGPCKATAGGGCSTDSDCVLARCADSACNCGCGISVARSRLGKDHPCLIATGNPAPAGCHPSGPICGCLFVDCTNVRAVCTGGQCASTGP